MRSLVICTTCKHPDGQPTADDGRTGGETLIDEMQGLLDEKGREDIRVMGQKCLWSCKRHCNVWMRDTGRFSYLAGDFEPTRKSAEAILGWFDLHGESAFGTVRFKQWPDGMRGHFIARMPAEGMPEDPV